MVTITVGECVTPDGRRGIYIAIGGGRVLLRGTDMTRLGWALIDGGRNQVSRVDRETLLPVLFECDADEMG